jgi:Mg2+-importing ATPase
VDPNQKERIILALRKTGHVVGYMGDGINDAPALHAADVGISVDTAVDVAKDAADFVLLKQDLDILREGIDEGRVTFANTLKYILTTISANFGNMFSMAGASLFLPFLPLLAPQILLNNFLSDIPATTIAGDNVDPEWVVKPRRWNTTFIRNYMVLFGLVSSIFDFLTFGALLFLFRASPDEFRTGWFIESLLTELVIALVVRTRHLFFRSRPGTLLLVSTLVVVCMTLVLPYLPFSSLFGFIPLPAPLMLAMIGLTSLYVVVTEVAKKYFYSQMENAIA